MQVKNILGSLWIFILVLSGITGQCTKPTTSDHAVVDDDDISMETFPAESAVKLRCHPGYEPNARIPHWFTCGIKGQWTPNPEKFTCHKKACGHPGEVANGYYEFPNGADFGATVRAVCKTGYFIIGENTRTCLADGQWEGREAVCEVVKCGPPPMISNGRPLNDHNEYQYANVVQYVCNSSYTLLGDNDLDIVCLENGTWSKEPRCVAVNCDRPDVLNARRVEGGSGPYGYGSTLRYECNDGCRMTSDTGRMVCLEHGWSSIPNCEAVNCDRPDVLNARRVDGGSGPYGYGSILRYECNVGYRMTSDTDRMVCLEHGWSSIPKCEDECRSPLGMESRIIPDENLSASSVFYNLVSLGSGWEPKMARLNNQGRINAWTAATNDESEWLQVDLGSKKHVTGIITQGAKDYGTIQYVSAFKVKYSNDSFSWQMLQDSKTRRDKIFVGNVDNNTPKKNMFDPPFYARYVRFLPWKWEEQITVRMELLGCRDN